MTILRKKISKKANAKINLFLDVLGKREDGFHEIRTIFSEISLSDRLNFTLTKNRAIQILTNIDSLNNQKNLAFIVAKYIQRVYKVPYGVKIDIQKNIPVAAGLGGGSSDAAAVINALSEIWNLELKENDKNRIAAKFGSDINFFLKGGTALGEGRGEKIKSIEPIEINNILLVKPAFEIRSSVAYKEVRDIHENNDWKKLVNLKDKKYVYNKLQEGIENKYQIIKDTLNKMLSFNAEKAILSGSGPTMIGFFDERVKMEVANEFFKKNDFWTKKTKTIKKAK